MDGRPWWKQPLRVLQTNLQVKDTPLMDPEKIARETEELAANTLVVNVGGIYAWYPSTVKFHHVNEYLPKTGDLLRDILRHCHARGIRVIARFDFSKTDDFVFQQRPQWFVRDSQMKPTIYGRDRMGEWTLLLSTCINAGYRNEELAVPVLNEVLDGYDIDGIFLNAPQYELCHCDACREKYLRKYGKPLPEERAQFEPGWESDCVKDNVGLLYRAIKAKRPEVPMILYYNPHVVSENLEDRFATADMICAEAQDVLSRGYREIPQFWQPALNIKLGRRLQGRPVPFGIIHSCPGMDWRHTGLPPAEYLFWLSQVPAHGGSIWHSVTGFADTISDKRILSTVGQIDRMIQRTEADMDGAVPQSQIALYWNSKPSAEGWAEGLIHSHTQFDVMDGFQLDAETLRSYAAVLLPEESPMTSDAAAALEQYVGNGGSLIVEGTRREHLQNLMSLIAIEGGVTTSEYLAASYVRFEPGCGALQTGMEETPLIAHRGQVAYCHLAQGTQVLATLVPPFAPLDAVGAPPERASILTPHTDLPLCTLRRHGRGQVLFLPFQLSMLAREYKLLEHYTLMRNCISLLLGDALQFQMDHVPGLQAMLYRNGGKYLLHLVNGIGQRPLAANIPYHGLNFSIRLAQGERVSAVTSVLGGETVTYAVKDGVLRCTLQKLDVWDMIRIDLE